MSWLDETRDDYGRVTSLHTIDNYIYCSTRGYFKITGRASRGEYWKYVFVNTLVNLILISLMRSHEAIPLYENLFYGYTAFTFIPSITTMVRRLHDTNKTGVWSILLLIPFVSFILFIPALKKSDEGRNDYGERHYFK